MTPNLYYDSPYLLGYHLWLLTGKAWYGQSQLMSTPYYPDDVKTPDNVVYARRVLGLQDVRADVPVLGAYSAALASSMLLGNIPGDSGHLFTRGILRVATPVFGAYRVVDGEQIPLTVQPMAPDSDHPFSFRFHPTTPTTTTRIEIAYVNDAQAALRIGDIETRIKSSKSLFMVTFDFPETIQHTSRFAFDDSSVWSAGAVIQIDLTPQRYPYGPLAATLRQDNNIRTLLEDTQMTEPFYSAQTPVHTIGALAAAIMRSTYERTKSSAATITDVLGAALEALPPDYVENQLSFMWRPLYYTGEPLTYDAP
jgi:hypothetical protein